MVFLKVWERQDTATINQHDFSFFCRTVVFVWECYKGFTRRTGNA